MVSIVTPGLAATAIVLERQRRSLDLVFSAPVAPRYYLVGKTIAVYRYIWMLLILSLPVTAACVVLGGASWGDVLTVYALLSFHGLLFAAIGLLVSTLSTKPVSAVVWTYAAVGGTLIGTGALAATATVVRAFGGGRGAEQSFLVGLSPFTLTEVVGTFTRIGRLEVPNWVLAIALILVAVRLCLLGAGSLLSEGRETPNLRIHWTLVVAATAYAAAYWLVGSGGYSRGGYGVAPSFDPQAVALGYGLFYLLAPLVLALPTLAAYGFDGTGRQRPNGAFRLRSAFDGTPAGALPYLAVLVTTATLFGLIGIVAAGGSLPSAWFLAYALYVFGFWTLFWGIARTASSLGTGLRAARTSVVAAFVVLVALPVPFLVAVAPETFDTKGFSLWDLYILRPVALGNGKDNPFYALGFGLTLLLLGLGLNAWSEGRRVRKGAALA